MLEQQLPLSIMLRDDCTLDSFFPGDNEQVVTQLKKMAQNKGEQFIYLWGRHGVGCSHLLQGACHLASTAQIAAIYLPLATLSQTKPNYVLEGIEKIQLVCIDDLQAIVGNLIWEEALFHLFNQLRALSQKLVIAANVAPPALGIKLPDLQSRLSWGITYQIHALNDEQLLSALQQRAKARGLDLTEEVGIFLIRRCSRTMPDLCHVLDILDRASLAAQRRLTVPFVKRVLNL